MTSKGRKGVMTVYKMIIACCDRYKCTRLVQDEETVPCENEIIYLCELSRVLSICYRHSTVIAPQQQDTVWNQHQGGYFIIEKAS